MKSTTAIVIATAGALALSALWQPADAQVRSRSDADAYSAAGASAGAAAVNGGNTVIFPAAPESTRSRGTVTYDGDYTLRNVPQVTAPSMSSGHPCGLGNSLGISIVGGGAAGGSTRSDDACLLAQMGHTQAATVMIAGRNRSACRALVASGAISNDSYCGGGGAARQSSNAAVAVSPRPKPRVADATVISTKSAVTIPHGSVTCGDPIRVKSWARERVSNATAVAFCRQ